MDLLILLAEHIAQVKSFFLPDNMVYFAHNREDGAFEQDMLLCVVVHHYVTYCYIFIVPVILFCISPVSLQ